MIHYLEREWGIHFAMGGTGALVNGLVQLIDELGGKIHFNTEVAEILVEGRRSTGIRLGDGSIHKADHVISNADVAWTYTKMIPSKARGLRNSDFRYKHLTKYSMSLFVLYFGTKRRYTDSDLAHHNIILGERYKNLLNDIFNKKVLAEDFSLYLHMPTITDPSLAPEGGETFYVLSPVPHLGAADIDWKTAAKPYRDAIMQFLEDNYLPDLQANLVVEHAIDPLLFPRQTQQPPGRRIFCAAGTNPISLVPPTQPIGRFRQPVFRRGRHTPWCRIAGRVIFIQDR